LAVKKSLKDALSLAASQMLLQTASEFALRVWKLSGLFVLNRAVLIIIIIIKS
jgi:hypothetical protein